MVMNDLSRLNLVADVIDRLPQLGSRAAYAKQAIREKLIEHKEYVSKYGVDLPEISDWKWPYATEGDAG
jgi:xylulose-5-phosphate/fructose-6-phosphate phosphoketolase